MKLSNCHTDSAVFFLLETWLLNAALCHDISVPVWGYRQGTNSCFLLSLTGIRNNRQRSVQFSPLTDWVVRGT